MEQFLGIALIVFACLAALCGVAVILLYNDERLPFLFALKEWKVWRECWKDEIVYVESNKFRWDGSVWVCRRYFFSGGKYYASLFVRECDGGTHKELGIYDAETCDCVWCDYWKPYGKKMILKLETWNDGKESLH